MGFVAEGRTVLIRTLLFLTSIALLAFIGFRLLVDNEVKRVVTVHVIDKADHLVDMFLATSPNTLSATDSEFKAEKYSELAGMAAASHVNTIIYFDLQGTKVGRLQTADFVGQDISSHTGHTDHSAHVSTQQSVPNQQDAPKHKHLHGAAHHHSDPNWLALLDTVPEPDAAFLRPIVDGKTDNLISIETLIGTHDLVINYAKVVLPVTSADGARIGYISFLMDVSHIYSVYAHGVATFGMLFAVCGVVLFGVPALAFWLQKKLAERSSRDANYLSRHDPLTGLLNRSAFLSAAQKRLEQDNFGYAAFIDADRFKLINDTYGHSVGDAFLSHIATLLQSQCGQDALIGRLGGDEFTLVVPPMPQGQAEILFENLKKEAAQDVELDGFAVSASISIGIAKPKPDEDLDLLLQRADTALYFAKANGRNIAAFFNDDMGAAARRRRMLEARLKDASRDGDFEIFYQPLVDAATSETLGYEALLRLTETDGAPIPPYEFVPLAEEIGLIEDIGTWVLQKATAEISALDGHSSVSVNLSAEQFRSGKLVDVVAKALQSSGLPAHRLELEITESTLIEEDNGADFQIDTLKEMGLSIAMDDFGTGFSSLSTLWRYGFDRIKIDKSFVHALNDTPERSGQLIDAIILLGARMGMSITAEGIETDDQRKTLTDKGCNVLQGYLFGRPEPMSLHKAAIEASKTG